MSPLVTAWSRKHQTDIPMHNYVSWALCKACQRDSIS